MTLPDALITGLLVVYPALATVVAVIVGLYLSGPGRRRLSLPAPFCAGPKPGN